MVSAPFAPRRYRRFREAVAVICLLCIDQALAEPILAERLFCFAAPDTGKMQYLVGSYHVPGPLDVRLGRRLSQAIAASDRVVFESVASISPSTQRTLDAQSDLAGKLDPPWPQTLQTRLDQWFSSRIGPVAANWREYPLNDLMVLLDVMIVRASEVVLTATHPSLDDLLRREARKQGKQEAALESLIEQRIATNGIPSSTWAKIIQQQIETIDCKPCAVRYVNASLSVFPQVVAGDWAGLSASFTPLPKSIPYAAGAAIRDPRLVERIVARTRDGRSRLFVVGGLHIEAGIGPGIVPLLRQRGIRVVPDCDPAS